MSKRKSKNKTIGKMTKNRLTWAINPVTKIVKSKKHKNDRKIVKQKLKKGDWND